MNPCLLLNLIPMGDADLRGDLYCTDNSIGVLSPSLFVPLIIRYALI